jgi:N-acetylglucosaminyldiphosphoundecaprenol N-acetyl-beta-D-mannosaminyltransferase
MEFKPRLRLLGAEVDVVTPAEVMAFTAARVASGQRAVVANHNAHSLYLIRRDAEMRAFYARADLIEIDSVPMIAWGRLLGAQVSRAHRCTYLDWREDFWGLAAREGWRVFHLGCAPGVGEAARAAVLKRHPGVQIAVKHGFFDMAGAENAQVLAEIAAFQPHILFVGMGMPRQEAWIAANFDRLPEAVIFPIGAAFDFEAGRSTTPPRWTGRLGLEWLHRFAHEPGRLFSRYFVEPWSLLGAAAGDVRRVVFAREALAASR